MSQVQDYEKLSLNRIVDNLPFSLYSKDSEGKYVDMNKLCFDMINQYEKVGVKGHKNESLFPQDIADKLSQNDEEALKSKHIKRFIEHIFH